MWKSFAIAAAVAVAVVGSVTPASATSTEPSRPAGAPPSVVQPQGTFTPMAGPYRMRNRGTELCMGGDQWGYTGMQTCSSASHQYWYWNQHADGWWEIKNMANGLCLQGFSGNQVGTRPCGSAGGQKWQRLNDAHIDNSGSFNMLDANQNDVYLHPWNDGNYQKWDRI